MPWQITPLRDEHNDLGITAVAEGGRVGPVVDQKLMADPVEFVGGDPGLHVGSHEGQRVGCQPAGRAHELNGFRCLHIEFARARGVFAIHVFGLDDVGGDSATR